MHNSRDSKSNPESLSDIPPEKDAKGNNSRNLFRLPTTLYDTFDAFGNFETPGQESSFGHPSARKIWLIWSGSP